MENLLLNKLIDAVSFYFKDDSVCAGVVISTLRDDCVYASVVRYSNNRIKLKSKKIICNVKAPTLSQAITLLSKRFVEYCTEEQVALNPLEILKKAIIYK